MVPRYRDPSALFCIKLYESRTSYQCRSNGVIRCREIPPSGKQARSVHVPDGKSEKSWCVPFTTTNHVLPLHVYKIGLSWVRICASNYHRGMFPIAVYVTTLKTINSYEALGTEPPRCIAFRCGVAQTGREQQSKGGENHAYVLRNGFHCTVPAFRYPADNGHRGMATGKEINTVRGNSLWP